MNIIGLTGGIGSGKTTVSDEFTKIGINVIDADDISRSALSPGSVLVEQVVSIFSEDILDKTTKIPTIDRSKLRTLIFKDKDAKLKLERVVHPVVRNSIIDEIEKEKESNQNNKQKYLILSSPLLFETQQDKMCNKAIVVDLPEALQIERSTTRDNSSAEQIQNIINSQMPRDEKLRRADYRIDNSTNIEHTYKQVHMLHNMLCSQM